MNQENDVDSNGNGTVRINTEVLATQLSNVVNQVNKLESKLDAYASHFVTAEVYELKHRELELSLNALTTKEKADNEAINTRIDNMDKNRPLKMWIFGTTTAAGGILLALLIQFFLTHQGGH